jgi:hypothetical protein
LTSPPDAAKPHLPGERTTGISTTFKTQPTLGARDSTTPFSDTISLRGGRARKGIRGRYSARYPI